MPLLRAGIGAQLALLIAVTLLPFLVFGGYAVFVQSAHYEQDQAEDGLLVAQLLAARVDDNLGGLDTLLNALAVEFGDPLGDTASNDRRLRALTKRLADSQQAVWLIDVNGREVGSTNSTLEERARLDFTDRAYFQQAPTAYRLNKFPVIRSLHANSPGKNLAYTGRNKRRTRPIPCETFPALAS